MIAYKVVVAPKDKDYRVSCILGGKYAVKYYPGVPAHPVLEGSLLFVFNNLDRAISFAQYLGVVPAGLLEVWKCEVDFLTPAPRAILWMTRVGLRNSVGVRFENAISTVRRYWKNPDGEHRCDTHHIDSDLGYYQAKEVTLTERIWTQEDWND